MQYGRLLTDLRLGQSLHQLITLYNFLFIGGGGIHENLPEYIILKHRVIWHIRSQLRNV